MMFHSITMSTADVLRPKSRSLWLSRLLALRCQCAGTVRCDRHPLPRAPRMKVAARRTGDERVLLPPAPCDLCADQGLLPLGAPREQFYRRRRHATAPAARTTAAPAMSRNASRL